jgi:hypothetical protein
MTTRELESIVLTRDLPAHGLRQGDLGTVVLLYDTGAMEVEFVRASGYTQALVELDPSDVRPANDDNDIPAMRQVDQKPKAE